MNQISNLSEQAICYGQVLQKVVEILKINAHVEKFYMIVLYITLRLCNHTFQTIDLSYLLMVTMKNR